MNTFKHFFTEGRTAINLFDKSYQIWTPGPRGTIKVYVNPTTKNLIECVTGSGKASTPRGILDTTTDNFYIWNSIDGVHSEVYKNSSIIPNPRQMITLEIYLTANYLIENIEVSASMHKMSIWDKLPQTKNRILRSKNIKHLIAPHSLNNPNIITYYDGTDWEKNKPINSKY